MIDTPRSTRIRPVTPADVDSLVALSLTAWTQPFESFRRILGPVIFELQYPDWRGSQAKAVRDACSTDGWGEAFVIDHDDEVAGFVVIGVLDDTPPMGEIGMIAVDSRFARRGLAEALMSFAVETLRGRGFDLATIFTGGDPGHAPARALYEKSGFTALPTARYYLALDQ